jgi:hypothetical protein
MAACYDKPGQTCGYAPGTSKCFGLLPLACQFIFLIIIQSHPYPRKGTNDAIT